MKNNRIAFLPGFSLFMCFCLLTGTGKLAGRLGGGAPLLALAEVISFLLPPVMLIFCMKDRALVRRLRFRRLPRGMIWLAALIGVTAAVLSLFLNLLIYQIAGLAGMDLSAAVLGTQQPGLSTAGHVAVVILLSPVIEELYLRGTLLAAHEQVAGTGPCLLFSGLVFAMLHGDPMNFAGPLAAGAAYAYLTYVSGSVWPAVLAHMINNLYSLFVNWITNTYAAFGLGEHLAALNALILLLSLYLTMRSLQALLMRDSIPHFDRSAGLYDIFLLIRNPGVLAFAAAFIAKTVLHLL